jgi:hypothetical protein
MAGTQWQVKTYGDTIVHRKLMMMADQAEDLSEAWPEVVEIAARGYERSYELQGPGWPDLKANTVRQRIAKGFPPGPIRTRSGRDRGKMTNPLELHFRGRAHSVDIFGTEVAELHQHGTPKMPARPLKLTRYYQDQMSLAIRNTLSEAYDRG